MCKNKVHGNAEIKDKHGDGGYSTTPHLRTRFAADAAG
jgi:hypothetical protein